MKNLRFILMALMLGMVSFLAVVVYKGEVEKRYYKEDLVELSKVKYGIFSVDEWKSILEDILTRKVEEFNFNDLPREEIQSAVSAVFEAHPAHFALSFAALSSEARDHAVGALLGGWLRRALDGRAPLDPPSARLADLASSSAAHGLQARLAMREAPYLKALRDALEGRRGVVT